MASFGLSLTKSVTIEFCNDLQSQCNALNAYIIEINTNLNKIEMYSANGSANESTLTEIAKVTAALNELGYEHKRLLLEEILIRKEAVFVVPCAKILTSTGIGVHLPSIILNSPWLNLACCYICLQQAMFRVQLFQALISEICQCYSVNTESEKWCTDKRAVSANAYQDETSGVKLDPSDDNPAKCNCAKIARDEKSTSFSHSDSVSGLPCKLNIGSSSNSQKKLDKSKRTPYYRRESRHFKQAQHNNSKSAIRTQFYKGISNTVKLLRESESKTAQSIMNVSFNKEIDRMKLYVALTKSVDKLDRVKVDASYQLQMLRSQTTDSIVLQALTMQITNAPPIDDASQAKQNLTDQYTGQLRVHYPSQKSVGPENWTNYFNNSYRATSTESTHAVRNAEKCSVNVNTMQPPQLMSKSLPSFKGTGYAKTLVATQVDLPSSANKTDLRKISNKANQDTTAIFDGDPNRNFEKFSSQIFSRLSHAIVRGIKRRTLSCSYCTLRGHEIGECRTRLAPAIA